ncbi:MAG TPA: hypothetical protein VFS52_08660 [Steroidobacteraceae bacterium]|nr:hypothetical protein [Steroidobacteraceae bacterium]
MPRTRRAPTRTADRAQDRPGSRPLRTFADSELAARFDHALAHADGVLGAHCIHEQWMRGGYPARIESALDSLWRVAASTIPEWLPMRYVSWLPTSYEVAARFTATGKGRYNIYLVLLDYADRRGDEHGVYVGMTQYTPAQRFDQHKAGIRAAGCVLKRGIEVLTGPTLHLQRIKRSDAVRIEVELAEALRDAGVHTEGGH